MAKITFPKLYYVIRPIELIPKHMGIAYKHWNQDSALAVLIPFNYPIGWLHELWLRLKYGPGESILDKAYWKGYNDGQRDLKTTVYSDATKYAIDLMKSELDKLKHKGV